MKKPVFVRWAPWWALGAVVVVVLAIGSHRPGPPPTLDQRVDQIASGIRCPSCADLSAAQSDASTAIAVRNDIRHQLLAGHSATAIKDSLVARYGPGILLTPPSGGFNGTLWLLPIVAIIGGGGAIAIVLWRRRGRGVGSGEGPSADDERLVEAEMSRSDRGGPDR